VVQPLLVSTSAFTLATECVAMILKIDDLVSPPRVGVLHAAHHRSHSHAAQVPSR
jgi:hypothetical protein